MSKHETPFGRASQATTLVLPARSGDILVRGESIRGLATHKLVGTGVAYVYSVVGTIAPGIFPATFRGHGGAVAVYFESAAVITVLVLLGPPGRW